MCLEELLPRRQQELKRVGRDAASARPMLICLIPANSYPWQQVERNVTDDPKLYGLTKPLTYSGQHTGAAPAHRGPHMPGASLPTDRQMTALYGTYLMHSSDLEATRTARKTSMYYRMTGRREI